MKKRLFLGIPISQLHQDKLAYIQQHKTLLFPKNRKVRFVNPANYHITISFIGYLEEENLDAVIQRTEQASKNIEAFSLAFDKIMLAPQDGTKRMVWATFQESEQFTHLSEAIRNATEQFQSTAIAKRRHKPCPHITLARFATLSNKSSITFKKPGIKHIHVSSFALFESKLSPLGPSYTVLRKFSLK